MHGHAPRVRRKANGEEEQSEMSMDDDIKKFIVSGAIGAVVSTITVRLLFDDNK